MRTPVLLLVLLAALGLAASAGARSAHPCIQGNELWCRLAALPSAPRVRVPALYVAAEQDQNDPYDFAADARRLYEATGSTEKRLLLVPGSLHGVFLVAGAPAARDLLERFTRDPRAAVRT